MDQVVKETNCPNLNLISKGKVRDMYELGENLLIVTSDRISAFDVVLPNGIPGKGRLLTNMSLFWLAMIEDIVPNHLITAKVSEMGDSVQEYAEILSGRSMLVKKAEVIPIECIVRGYIVGSAWKEYQKTQTICGEPIREGYIQADKLEEPIFTPSTKAEEGEHDENISYEEMCKRVGPEISEKLRDLSLSIYKRARDHAVERGIIIADTKFEFGIIDGEVHIIDEVLTPDSSRYWPASEYAPGQSPSSFDKQFVRDYLEKIGWDKNPPAPELPEEIVTGTSDKYSEALKYITKVD